MKNQAKEYAAAFTEAGYSVFLLQRIDQELLQSRTAPEYLKKSNGKMPLKPKWQESKVLDDEELVELQELLEFGLGYGVLCNNGLINLLVIDVDARNGGVESYQKFINDFPALAGCGLIVETGSGEGSRHLYFKMPKDTVIASPMTTDFDGKRVHVYPGVDFQRGAKFVVGPGSPHRSGNHYRVLSGSVQDIDFAPDDFLEFLKPPERMRFEHDGEFRELDKHVLKSLLDAIPNSATTDYDYWLKVGMAVHEATNGTGEKLWLEWSRQSPKHENERFDRSWHSFGKNSGNQVTIGTLIHEAKENGWTWPDDPMMDIPIPEAWLSWGKTKQVPEDSEKALDVVYAAPIGACPINVSTVDLQKPPGFVGEVTQWINDQCEYPRENLAAMAAVFSVANIAGLHYRADDERETSTNLMLFCIAGSSSGKDAVLTAANKLLDAAGMVGAVHGSVKSSRELEVNFQRNQAAIYTIDEIGEHLRKIHNASKSGASHLENVMALLMDHYTKTNSQIKFSGDMSEDYLMQMNKRRDGLLAKLEDLSPDEIKRGKRQTIEDELTSLNVRISHRGVVKFPYLSLMGFSTPETFAETMTLANVAKGFLGRAILCIEEDDNPRHKRDFKARPMSHFMAARLASLCGGGFGQTSDFYRVENLGNIRTVPVAKDAKYLLAELKDWIYERNSQFIKDGEFLFTPIRRRTYEKIARVALVLALGRDDEKEIGVEEVTWAAALAFRDEETKIAKIKQEDASFAGWEQMAARIMATITKNAGNPMTAGIISGAPGLRKADKKKVQEVLDRLVLDKVLKTMNDTNKKTGAPLLRYYLP